MPQDANSAQPARQPLLGRLGPLYLYLLILLMAGGGALEALSQAASPVAQRSKRQTRRASKKMNPQARHLTAAIPAPPTPAPNVEERTAMTPQPSIENTQSERVARREYAAQQRQTSRAERRAEKIARREARDRAKLQRSQDRTRAGENNRRTFRKRTRR